jgi:hypothetical protein
MMEYYSLYIKVDLLNWLPHASVVKNNTVLRCTKVTSVQLDLNPSQAESCHTLGPTWPKLLLPRA